MGLKNMKWALHFLACAINKGVGKILFVLDAFQRQTASPPKMSLHAIVYAHPAPLPSIVCAPLELGDRGVSSTILCFSLAGSSSA